MLIALAAAVFVALFIADPDAVRDAGPDAVRQNPDFSGGWSAVADAPPGVAPATGPVFGARFWLEHRGDRLTVIRPVRDAVVRAGHTLDGPEVRSPLPGSLCIGESAVVTRVAREGSAIVHTTVASIPPGGQATVPSGARHIFRLEAPDTLVVESTRQAPGQGDRKDVATVYRRISDPPPPEPARPAVTTAPAMLGGLAWLSGTWDGTLGTAAIEERWTPAEGGSMLGTSRTVRNTAVTSFEFLCIAERGSSLVYSAMPNGRAPATDFLLTAIDASSATFENPGHDFPKKIRYALRPDGSLEATISGDRGQRAMAFVFTRRSNP